MERSASRTRRSATTRRFYPATGGIRVLPEAFLPGVALVACGTDSSRSTTVAGAVLRDAGERIESYDRLVSTIPPA
ncbi:MAG: hypothetical protein U0231_00630 [Nitrospiraceae bacterium]